MLPDISLDDMPGPQEITEKEPEAPVIPVVPLGKYGEIPMANLLVRKFPDALRHTVEYVAGQQGITPDDWIIQQCLAALGFVGYDPCPTWRPTVKKS